MLNDIQTRALQNLVQNPNARIHGNTRRVLETRGLVSGNGVTLAGYHACGMTIHHPKMPVPLAEEWAHLRGKSVLITENREPDMAEVYGEWESFTLSIDKIMPRYVEFAEAVNKEISKIWTPSVDREYAHCLAHNHIAYVNPKWAMQKARANVSSDILGHYTGDITAQIVQALLDGQTKGDLGGHSHKYSYSDTDDEVKMLEGDQDSEIAATFDFDVWR